MKNFTKFAKSLTLALAITLGASAVPTQKAEAGIIVIAASGGVLGPLIGLSMSATGFFWGIQTDDLNILAAFAPSGVFKYAKEAFLAGPSKSESL